MPRFHRIDIAEVTGGAWRATCTCGYDGELHKLGDSNLSIQEARRDAGMHTPAHTYRIVCPDCRRHVRARPMPQYDQLRMAAHNRPADAEEHPGQTCEATPTIPTAQVELAPQEAQ